MKIMNIEVMRLVNIEMKKFINEIIITSYGLYKAINEDYGIIQIKNEITGEILFEKFFQSVDESKIHLKKKIIEFVR